MGNEEKELQSFLSDAHAIQNARLPIWARHTLLYMGGFFLLAILWACLSHVDIIINANGKLVSSRPTIVMKPLERAVIKDTHVAIGDRVTRGDLLATFDTTFSRADKERLAAETRIYEALFNRLRAEFNNAAYEKPAQPTEEDIVQFRLYNDRKRFYAERVEYFDREIERISKTKQSLSENLDLQTKRLQDFRDIESMLARARSSQAVSPRDLKEARISRRELEADISDKKNNILVLESELLSKEAEKNAFCSNWRIELGEELVKTRTALTNVKKDFDKAAQMAAYVELRAPEDAVVHDIAPMSIGSAVREAEALITLVPLEGGLEVEAEIRADDIARVKLGDRARIKISAFPFQKYGTLPGTVRVISEDSFTSQEGRGAFYRARIGIDKDADGEFTRKLMPGMEAQAEIITGTRRIIEYLVHPLIKSLDEAIHEP